MMPETGRGAQVVIVKEHKFLLDEEELKRILLREEIRDLPVVLVSVAGAYRGGKSFLLNFFLRYLTSPQSARDNDSWLGEGNVPLEGFSWRSGSTRNTTGIIMWSEPIICTLPTGHKAGNKVAVLLLDTQGTFDSSSTVNECSIIFAVSTLLSSVQIYNLSQNIQEDHLQHLHLFTEYGKLVREQDNDRAFQILQFLVRDWPYDWELEYGYTGGEQLLQKRLQIIPGMSKELKEVRSHISSCFEKVTCFLMPNPGQKVTRPDFKGNINEINENFILYLKELVSSIFSPEKLEPKVINGKIVIARDLFTYFKSYMIAFSSGAIPPTASIMKVTTQAGLLTAVREELAQYEDNMERECGEKTKCIPAIDIKVLHDRHKSISLTSFNAKKKMGTTEDAKPYCDKLSKDIDKRLEQYAAINTVKQQKVTEEAKKAYNDKIKKITGELLCVHPKDLKDIHKKASNAALKYFDANRHRITDQNDPEKDNFKESLKGKLQLLKAINDTNNKQVIADLRNVYWQHMENTTVADPVLTKTELQKEHDEGLVKVLEGFKKKRNRADSYATDVYKSQLLETIQKRYNEIKDINKSGNRRAMKAVLGDYNTRMASVWDQQNQTLHPEDLKQDHEIAKNLALAALYPNNNFEFKISNEDGVTLQNILSSRYKELQETNAAMNRESIQSAHNVYKDTLEERIRPSWWWLLVVPMVVSLVKIASKQYHEESVADAKVEFYKKRRDNGPESTDIYLHELIRAIEGKPSIDQMCSNAIQIRS